MRSLWPEASHGGIALQRTKRDAKTLARSVEKARAANASLHDKLSAAEFLVAYGMSDEADAAIASAVARMHASGVTSGPATARLIERLSIVSRHFRNARVVSRLQALGGFGDRLMDEADEAVLHVAKGSTTLLVVFGSMFNDFWVSFPVLHCLMPNEVSVLYLKDPQELMYLNGLKTYGDGFEALCTGVRGVADQLGVNDVRVTGFSSGGYAGLRLAGEIGASAYLGFSVRTDLSVNSPLPTERYVERQDLRDVAGHLMIDLKPWLAERATLQRGILYHGDGTTIDAEHAKHLADLPNFGVKELPGTKHNTIVTLLADGKFENILRRFVR